MKADDRIIFRLSSSLKAAFIEKVEKLGKKQAEVLIELLQEFVEKPDASSELELVKHRLLELESEVSKLKDQQEEYVGKLNA